MSTTLTITEIKSQISVEEKVVKLTIGPIFNPNNLVFNASNIGYTPYPGLEGANLQEVLENLTDESFNQATAPSIAVSEEGNTWYNTADNSLYVYRETSPGIFAWVPIMVGNISPSSDVVDAGSF